MVEFKLPRIVTIYNETVHQIHAEFIIHDGTRISVRTSHEIKPRCELVTRKQSDDQGDINTTDRQLRVVLQFPDVNTKYTLPRPEGAANVVALKGTQAAPIQPGTVFYIQQVQTQDGSDAYTISRAAPPTEPTSQ